MKISIFGLGYVGTVCGACFARFGHEVIGVDRNRAKVDFINKGLSPVIEDGLQRLVSEARRKKRFYATYDAESAVMNSDISMVCVGTYSHPDGSVNLDSVIKVCKEIGGVLRKKKRYHLVVIRSTVFPGSIERIIIPALERSSKGSLGKTFGVCSNPEFMREGSSIRDFIDPSFTLIGSASRKDALLLEKVYGPVETKVIRTDYKTAEMIKYVCNAFHALKITFANEIGVLCRRLGIDGYRVMEIFSQDSKLNISKAYLKPGFAFGGSCLGKDLRAMIYKAKHLDIELPMLNSIMPSNERQIRNVLDVVVSLKKKKIGLVGLSFKAGTDDLRESPLVILSEYLIGKGYDLRIFDDKVSLAKLTGANKVYIEKMIPHISGILVSDMRRLIHDSEIIIVGNKSRHFVEASGNLSKSQTVIDLVRAFEGTGKKIKSGYYGIGW